MGVAGVCRVLHITPATAMLPLRLRHLKLFDQFLSYLKLGQELFVLYKYLKRYQKGSIALSLPLLNRKYFHLQAAGAFDPISCFVLT